MIRALTLRGAVAVNVITMIGIGPLVTIPLVLATMPGHTAMLAWIVGAILALCDGLIWAELDAAVLRQKLHDLGNEDVRQRLGGLEGE